jgi:deazaflavin-dependent oxidoreductase (nitroreductase family)
MNGARETNRTSSIYKTPVGRRVTGCVYRRWQMPDWNQRVIDEFRANGGRVGGPFEGRTLLLLHHRGAKTGTERVNPLAYQRLSDEAVAVFASKGGAPTNPDWYHNVIANPDVAVEIGTETIRARARVAGGEERERIWERQKHDSPGFADYDEKTKGIRRIPVIVLETI